MTYSKGGLCFEW